MDTSPICPGLRPRRKNTMLRTSRPIHKLEPMVWALILAVISLVFLRPSIRGHDGMGNYAYLMSALVDGDLDFTNEYAAFDSLRGESLLIPNAPVSPLTKLPANRYGIGAAIYWAVAVAPVHFLLKAINPEAATGLTTPYEWAVGVASAWWGCLGVWVLLLWLRERFEPAAAWGTAAGLLLATPLGFYVWAHGSMSHAVSFFISAMTFVALDRALNRPGPVESAAVGIGAGLLITTRVQDATWAFTAICALLTFGSFQKSLAKRLQSAAAFFCVMFIVLLPQLAVWRHLYGSWFSGPAPYLNREGGGFSDGPVHILQCLFNARHGALAWHPILLIGLVGLGNLYKSQRSHMSLTNTDEVPSLSNLRALAIIGLAGFALQALMIGSWSMWWAGASFGNRFFISSYPFLAVGIAAMFDSRLGFKRRWIPLLLLCVLIFWNAGLLVQYGTEMIPREDETSWIEIIVNQFTLVPEWILQEAL